MSSNELLVAWLSSSFFSALDQPSSSSFIASFRFLGSVRADFGEEVLPEISRTALSAWSVAKVALWRGRMRAAIKSGRSGVGMSRMLAAGARPATSSSAMGKSDLLALLVLCSAYDELDAGVEAGCGGWDCIGDGTGGCEGETTGAGVAMGRFASWRLVRDWRRSSSSKRVIFSL